MERSFHGEAFAATLLILCAGLAVSQPVTAEESRLAAFYLEQGEEMDSGEFREDFMSMPGTEISEIPMIPGSRVEIDIRPMDLDLRAETDLLDPESTSSAYVETRHYDTLTISPKTPAFGSGRFRARWLYNGTLQLNSTGAEGQTLDAQFDVSLFSDTGSQLANEQESASCTAPCPPTSEVSNYKILEHTRLFNFDAPFRWQLFASISTSVLGFFNDTGNPTVSGDYFVNWLCMEMIDEDSKVIENWRDDFDVVSVSGFDYAAGTCDLPQAELVSSVLPASGSMQVPGTATAFATIINSGEVDGTDCGLSPRTSVPADFFYQTTDPSSNALTGTPNTPVVIPAGGLQTYLFAFTATDAFPPTEVELEFECGNSEPAATLPGVNTLLLSASTTPVANVVALAATPTDPGIVNLPSPAGTGFFTVATVNVGAADTMSVQADTGDANLPVTIAICETDPVTSICVNPAVPEAGPITLSIAENATPTFAIFVTGNGDPVAFDPAANRVYVRFRDAGDAVRGATSVAVRSQ